MQKTSKLVTVDALREKERKKATVYKIKNKIE
jgi:hypothetical protein